MISKDTFTSSPVVVLIPGSFSVAAMYYPILDKLQASGVESYVTTLPSASRNPPESPASLADDIDAISNTVRTIVDQGKEVVLLAHSYGGMVASGLPLELSQTHRRKNAQDGGVISIIFLAAIVLPVGRSVIDDQGMPPSRIVLVDEVCGLFSARLRIRISLGP
jgi:pimeloyl-ACP methyl ester carboxylesterase